MKKHEVRMSPHSFLTEETRMGLTSNQWAFTIFSPPAALRGPLPGGRGYRLVLRRLRRAWGLPAPKPPVLTRAIRTLTTS